MAKVYLINCRDAGVDCDFQARGSSLEEVMQLCADHGIREHNMKAFGPELYTKMQRCVKTTRRFSSSALMPLPQGDAWAAVYGLLATTMKNAAREALTTA